MTATASPVNLPMTLSKRGLSSSVCGTPTRRRRNSARQPASGDPSPRDERLIVRTAATRPCRRLFGPEPHDFAHESRRRSTFVELRGAAHPSRYDSPEAGFQGGTSVSRTCSRCGRTGRSQCWASGRSASARRRAPFSHPECPGPMQSRLPKLAGDAGPCGFRSYLVCEARRGPSASGQGHAKDILEHLHPRTGRGSRTANGVGAGRSERSAERLDHS
jgi:hypothetical protein